jgi:hypothetical protein
MARRRLALDEADHRYSYFTVQDAEGRNFLLRARFTMAAAGEGHKCRIIMTISNLTLEQLGGQSFKVIKVRLHRQRWLEPVHSARPFNRQLRAPPFCLPVSQTARRGQGTHEVPRSGGTHCEQRIPHRLALHQNAGLPREGCAWCAPSLVNCMRPALRLRT